MLRRQRNIGPIDPRCLHTLNQTLHSCAAPRSSLVADGPSGDAGSPSCKGFHAKAVRYALADTLIPPSSGSVPAVGPAKMDSHRSRTAYSSSSCCWRGRVACGLSRSLARKKLEHRLLVSPSSGGRGCVFRTRLSDYRHLVKPAELSPFYPGANTILRFSPKLESM